MFDGLASSTRVTRGFDANLAVQANGKQQFKGAGIPRHSTLLSRAFRFWGSTEIPREKRVVLLPVDRKQRFGDHGLWVEGLGVWGLMCGHFVWESGHEAPKVQFHKYCKDVPMMTTGFSLGLSLRLGVMFLAK